METPKSIPLWLHVVRLSVLVAAAAGVAWVVATAQKRGMRARAAAERAEPPASSAIDELTHDATAAEPAFDVIESTGDERGSEQVRFPPFDPMAVPVPAVPIDRSSPEVPSLSQEPVPAFRLPINRVPIRLSDPYMSSSKSIVIDIEAATDEEKKPRHGKP